METYTRGTLSFGLRASALLLAVVLFAACDEEKSSGNGGSASGSGGSSNLADYADNPCDLMSADDVRSVVPDLPADATHYTGTKSLKMCQYTWPSDRKATRTVMGRTIEYAVENTVCLNWIRKVRGTDALAWFKNAYRAMTPEEKAQMKAALEKAMDEKVESGEVSRDAKKVCTSTSGGMIDTLRFENVDGVGTAAAWGGTKDSVGLKVLDGDWEFEIQVDVSEDEAENRAAAIALAKKVLANAD